MNIQHQKLAKKYAKAFFNLFSDKIDCQIIEHICSLAKYFREHRRAFFYLQLTVIDEDGTKKNFDELLSSLGLNQIFKSLIELLIRDRRIFLLPPIMQSLHSLYLEKHGISCFTIESPDQPDKEEFEALKNFLKAKTRKEIWCDFKRNKNLIAGIKMYSETLCFERSIAKQLRLLSAATQGISYGD